MKPIPRSQRAFTNQAVTLRLEKHNNRQRNGDHATPTRTAVSWNGKVRYRREPQNNPRNALLMIPLLDKVRQARSSQLKSTRPENKEGIRNLYEYQCGDEMTKIHLQRLDAVNE